MPIPTPEQLHVALADHRRVRDACKALGTSLAAIRNRRVDGSYTHPDLVAVLNARAERSASEAAMVRVRVTTRDTIARVAEEMRRSQTDVAAALVEVGARHAAEVREALGVPSQRLPSWAVLGRNAPTHVCVVRILDPDRMVMAWTFDVTEAGDLVPLWQHACTPEQRFDNGNIRCAPPDVWMEAAARALKMQKEKSR